MGLFQLARDSIELLDRDHERLLLPPARPLDLYQSDWAPGQQHQFSKHRLFFDPVPGAPRLIVDGILGANGFPYGLVRETEFESVKAETLEWLRGCAPARVARVACGVEKAAPDGPVEPVLKKSMG